MKAQGLLGASEIAKALGIGRASASLALRHMTSCWRADFGRFVLSEDSCYRYNNSEFLDDSGAFRVFCSCQKFWRNRGSYARSASPMHSMLRSPRRLLQPLIQLLFGASWCFAPWLSSTPAFANETRRFLIRFQCAA
jgi:hypothetical protein